jgi:predicted RND superfamily exporter protein
MSIETQPKEPLNEWFRAFAHGLLRHRFKVLLVIVLITGFLGHQIATRLKVDNSIEAFTATEGEANRVLTELRTYFGKDDVFLVIVEGDVFTQEYAQRLKEFTDELWRVFPELEEDAVYQAKVSQESQKPPPRDAQPGKSAPSPEGFDEFEDEFEGDTEFDDSVAFNPPGKESSAYSGPTIFEEITSLINVRRARPTSGGVSFPKLMDPVPNQEQLDRMKPDVLSDRFLLGSLVNEEGSMSLVTLRTPAMQQHNTEIIYREIQKVAEKFNRDGFTIHVSGLPALTVELNTLMLGDLKRMLLLAALGMSLGLCFIFRHPIGVFGPLLVVMFSSIWTFGMMAAIGFTMTLLSSILPAFITCVGVGDSIHLLSVYRDRRAQGTSNDDSIAYALGSVGLPIVYTSLTTMMGLMSFQMSSLDAISEMGMSGAFGVFMAMLFSLVVLPIALTFNKKSTLGLKPKSERNRVDSTLDFFNNLSRPTDGPSPHRRRYVTLSAAFAILGLSILGMSQLKVSHDPISWVPEDNAVIKGFDKVEANFGGLSNIELLIKPNSENGMRDADLLESLDRLESDITAYRHTDGSNIVGHSFSLLDLIKETNRAANDLDPAADRLPENKDAIQDIITMVELSNGDATRRIATSGLDHSRMTFRVQWLDATSYTPLTKHIERAIDEHVGDKADIQKSGGLYTVFSIVSTLIYDLVRSFLFAFGVITLLMILFLRSLKLGLIAMVPNLLPIATIMGLMGFNDVPIDMNNLLIASIAMGLAVDDTIHFLHHFKKHYELNQDVESAVFHAIRYCGRAIMVTSIILSIGFYAYLGASMTNIQRFGTLVGSTVVIALLIDLVFCPALLRTFFKDRVVED